MTPIGHLNFHRDSQNPTAQPLESAHTTPKSLGISSAHLVASYGVENTEFAREAAQAENLAADKPEIFAHQAERSSNRPLQTESFTTDEKFELLSAYLDDEVTDEEKALVDHWLASDTEVQKIYQKQLQLRQAIRALLAQDV